MTCTYCDRDETHRGYPGETDHSVPLCIKHARSYTGTVERSDGKTPLFPDDRPWYDELHRIRDLILWLDKHDEHGPIDLTIACDILEKPWHWDAEYKEMLAERSDTQPCPPPVNGELEGDERCER